jgi:hypothetical protein
LSAIKEIKPLLPSVFDVFYIGYHNSSGFATEILNFFTKCFVNIAYKEKYFFDETKFHDLFIIYIDFFS